MGKSEEVVLEIAGLDHGTVKLKTYTVQKWSDVAADLDRLLPDIQRDGGASRGFKYRGAFNREKVVQDDESLERFFNHAVEEAQLTQSVVMVASIGPEAAMTPAPQTQTTAGRPLQVSPSPNAPPAAASGKSVVSSATVEFPGTPAGDTMLQVRPVVLWGKEQLTVSVFLSWSSQPPAASNKSSHFIFSYSKARPGTSVVELGLSSPSSLCLHLKGDVVETGVALKPSTWYHVAVTWSSRDGSLVLYIDGNKAFSASKMRVGSTLEQGGAFILGNFQGGAHAFVGCMAEVSVWKGSIERELIRKISQKPLLKGSEDRLCLYFNFKGTSSEDSSLIVDASSDIEGRLRGGAAVLKKPVAIRGGDGAAATPCTAADASAAFASSALRFEERSFGRLMATPQLASVAADELTLALWLSSVDTMQGGTVFSWAWVDGSGSLQRVELANCSNLDITVGPESASLQTMVAVNDGLWHFIVVTWKSKNGSLVLYVDGMERFARDGISSGLRLDGGTATAAGSGIMAVGQRIIDLSARGIRDLSQAYFGLVAHLSIWRAALSAPLARKLMSRPLEGAEKDLAVYLNPDSSEFGTRLLTDAAHAARHHKLEWKVLGPVDLVKSASIGCARPSAAALPLLDRQIISASIVLEAKTAGRVALQPLQLLTQLEDGSGKEVGGQMSICVWMKASAAATKTALDGECLFCYSSGPNAEGDAVALLVRDRSNITIAVDGQQIKTGCRLEEDVWHHVALTWQASDGACSLYLDCLPKWEGKIGKGAPLTGAHSSLWVGREHRWEVVKKATEAGVPAQLLMSVLYCRNKTEAATLLAAEEAAVHVPALKQVAGSSLPAFKGGDGAVAGALFEWLCRACCDVSTGFVGQVSVVCVWRRLLTRGDVAFVSNGALLGNEKALVACLDVPRYADEDKTIADRFCGDVEGVVVGGCRLLPHVELRKGVEWLPSHPPGTTPKSPGDMCALQLDKAPPGQSSCLLLSGFGLVGDAGPCRALTLSLLVRTSGHEAPGATLLSLAAGASLKELCLSNPGALEVEICGNRAATSAAVDDGYWHHLVVVWSSAVTKDAEGQPQQGELLVYLDAHLVHQGAGKSTGTGAAEVSLEAGTLVVGGRKEGTGAGYGGCLQGCLACLAIFNRRLDAKAVASLLASPVLRGSEKGLVLYLDFDFEPAGDTSTPACIGGGEVINRARQARLQAAGVLRGGARLVLLSQGYQVVPGQLASRREAPDAPALDAYKQRGAFETKCLQFKDKMAHSSAYLFPTDVVPDRQLTVVLWVRSSDVGGGVRDKQQAKKTRGRGTILSYAAYCRCAFNLRVTHKGGDGKEVTELVHVDGGMLLEHVVAKLAERFGEPLTFRHTLLQGQQQQASTVTSDADFDAFCEAVRKMQEKEEPTTPKSPAAAGRKERVQAIAVVSAPFAKGGKLATAAADAQRLAEMTQLEELCLVGPADLTAIVKGQPCKGQVAIDINDGRWHHVALTWSSRTGLLVLYVDGNVRLEQGGVQQGKRIAAGGCFALGQAQALLGSAFVDGSGFEGEMAQVGLWSKVLPRCRVLRSMCAPLMAQQDALLLLWDFGLDPLSATAQLSNAAMRSACSDCKGKIRDKSGLVWRDAVLPGDGRVCGLGRSDNKSDVLTVDVELCGIGEALRLDSRVKALFLHVVIGELGDDSEHALRDGGVPVAKDACVGLKHQQVVHVDALAHAAERSVLQAMLTKQGREAEAIMQLRLCTEVLAKSGEVSVQVVAKGQVDLMEYLEAGRDEVSKHVSLWAPGGAQAGGAKGREEAAATVKVSLEVVAALRALQADTSASARQQAALPAAPLLSGTVPIQELPAFERRKSNFSRASSTRSVLEGLGDANASAKGQPGVASHSPAAATAPAPAAAPALAAPPAPALPRSRAQAADAEAAGSKAAAAAAGVQTGASLHSRAASKKPHADDDMDLPERIVLHCGYKSGQTAKIAVDFELKWPQVRDVLERELGPGRCIQFTDARTREKCVVNQPKMWEKLRMQVEDAFALAPRTESGDAHVHVKVALANDTAKEGEGVAGVQGKSGGGDAAAAVQRSKGSNAHDNPDAYDLFFDCAQLGAGPWATGERVRITVPPDISWLDFRELVAQKFGAVIGMSYVQTDGKVVPLETEDAFNAACDQIEDEWDDADGDGSLACIAQPPQGGMPFVRGQSEVLVRLAAGDQRGALEAQVAKMAPRMQEDMAHLCALLRAKESKAPTWYPPPLPRPPAPPPASADTITARLCGITVEQVLKTVYSTMVAGQVGEEALVSALEQLVLDDDMLLALGYLPDLDNAGKRKQDSRGKGGAGGATKGGGELGTDARLVDWMSFVSRFRLASAHEAAVMAELHDVDLRAAITCVYLRRAELRQASADLSSQGTYSWEKCSQILKDACCLTDHECKRLVSWAQDRAASAPSSSNVAGRPPISDVLSLAQEAEVVDVGRLLPHALDELAVLRVLKRRAAVEGALASVQSQVKAGGVELSDAVSLVSGAAGLSLATARRLLLRTASVAVRGPSTAEGEGAGIAAMAFQQVVLQGWLDKLWIMHSCELDALDRIRDAQKQMMRRALVSSQAMDQSLVKAIRQCASEPASSDSAGRAKDAAARQGGMRGIKDAIVAACQREGVVCSLQEAQALCDEVPVVGGHRDVAGYVEGLRMCDVFDGSLDAFCGDLCPKIASFLEVCDKLDSVSKSDDLPPTLMLPTMGQIVQALVSVGVPVNAADAVAQQSGSMAEEPVDYRDLVCGRLLVLSERERERLRTPMAEHQRKTMEGRRRLVDRKAEVMAAMSRHDPLGRFFIDASKAVSVLQETLELPQHDCQALIDVASPPPPATPGAAQAPARRVDYSSLAGFQVVMARPQHAAFCGARCSGCAAVAESFLQRQTEVMQALHRASTCWRSSDAGRLVETVWGAGLLPYDQFEAILRSQLCGGAGGAGRWLGRHVRTLALSQALLPVSVSGLHSAASASEAALKAAATPDQRHGARALPTRSPGIETSQGAASACHLVRIEQFKQRFAVLEASDAAALERLVSMSHQRALASAFGALMRHRTPAEGWRAGGGQVEWSALQTANSPGALLHALVGKGEGTRVSEASEDDDDVPCGDYQALQDIWRAGSSLESLLDALVPVYCHMLPATPTSMLRHAKHAKASITKQSKAMAAREARAPGAHHVAAKGSPQGGGEQGEQGLTRGQQVFRKLLASRRPGVMQILQAMGAMTPTCVPSPLVDASRRYNEAPSSFALVNIDPASMRSLQLTFVEAKAVPDPGERYQARNRMLKLSLFDAYMMKFVGTTMSVELNLPKDDKPQNRQSWTPAKSVPSVFVSADLKNHAQMYLYIELHQRSQRKSDTAGSQVMEVSCGHALMALQDVPNGTTGAKELAVSGGTPFMPRPITQDLVDGGKSSGLLARLRQGTSAHKSVLSIKLEKVDKQTLEMVKSKRLPPNILCMSDAALPIAHFQTLSAQARSKSPPKALGAKGTSASAAAPPALEDLFTRAQVDQDPVLALFPKLRESPHMMAHLSAAWAFRYNRLSSKDKASNPVLQNLLRECTLIVWPLMKMRALKEASPKDASERQAAAGEKYIKAANSAKNLGDMYSVITASSTVAHQPFRIDELLE